MNALEIYCEKWALKEPKLLASTFTSEIYKVTFESTTAVLKILNDKGKNFEVRGALVLRCFEGRGAVRLLQADEGAHLLEYIDGPQLKSIVQSGEDKRATEIVCDIVEKIHQYLGPIPNDLIDMKRNFRSLFSKARTEPADSIYRIGTDLAERLIETEQEVKVLHGDIHHQNILESSTGGWLSIDPQCLFGERTYDLANTFYNPNGFTNLVESSETIQRRCQIFSKRLKIDPKRILEYAFVYGCLSAAWCIEDGQCPDSTLRIAIRIRSLL